MPEAVLLALQGTHFSVEPELHAVRIRILRQCDGECERAYDTARWRVKRRDGVGTDIRLQRVQFICG